jgi:hypothetical protein
MQYGSISVIGHFSANGKNKTSAYWHKAGLHLNLNGFMTGYILLPIGMCFMLSYMKGNKILWTVQSEDWIAGLLTHKNSKLDHTLGNGTFSTTAATVVL